VFKFVGRVSASVTRHRTHRRVTAQKPRLTRPTATASIMDTLFCGVVPSSSTNSRLPTFEGMTWATFNWSSFLRRQESRKVSDSSSLRQRMQLLILNKYNRLSFQTREPEPEPGNSKPQTVTCESWGSVAAVHSRSTGNDLKALQIPP
jgi:hypothetical protein